MKVLFSDQDYPDLTIERSVFDEAGIELVVGKSALTEDALIAAAKGCSAILLQYAPITGRVLDALPGIGLVSRIGAGFDTVDTKACGERGVWVANSPDYGIGEVSTHALAMALSLIRHLPFYDRDVKAGTWHFESGGPVRRCADMINGALFSRMKRGSYLVNTSRGAVIDIDTLVVALDEGRFDGVGLDVLPNEPIAAGHPLAKHPRVLLSPHAAFYSVESERDLRSKAARNIVTWMKTGRPDYIVVRGTRRPPHEIADEAITRTERVAETENQVREAIRGGMDSVDAYLKFRKF